MDKALAARDIIAHAAPLASFDGWNIATLQQAAVACGYKKTDVIRVFPGGAIDAVNAFFAQADDAMLNTLEGYSLGTMKIRERIATAVRIRICVHEDHPEALRRARALQSLPFFCHHAMKSLYRTVDTIWYAAGDSSTDFNFYTKRLMLAGVYGATLTFWLDDKSPGKSNSWAFLDRRIEDVMKIESAKHTLKRWFKTA